MNSPAEPSADRVEDARVVDDAGRPGPTPRRPAPRSSAGRERSREPARRRVPRGATGVRSRRRRARRPRPSSWPRPGPAAPWRAHSRRAAAATRWSPVPAGPRLGGAGRRAATAHPAPPACSSSATCVSPSRRGPASRSRPSSAAPTPAPRAPTDLAGGEACVAAGHVPPNRLQPRRRPRRWPSRGGPRAHPGPRALPPSGARPAHAAGTERDEALPRRPLRVIPASAVTTASSSARSTWVAARTVGTPSQGHLDGLRPARGRRPQAPRAGPATAEPRVRRSTRGPARGRRDRAAGARQGVGGTSTSSSWLPGPLAAAPRQVPGRRPGRGRRNLLVGRDGGLLGGVFLDDDLVGVVLLGDAFLGDDLVGVVLLVGVFLGDDLVGVVLLGDAFLDDDLGGVFLGEDPGGFFLGEGPVLLVVLLVFLLVVLLVVLLVGLGRSLITEGSGVHGNVGRRPTDGPRRHPLRRVLRGRVQAPGRGSSLLDGRFGLGGARPVRRVRTVPRGTPARRGRPPATPPREWPGGPGRPAGCSNSR